MDGGRYNLIYTYNLMAEYSRPGRPTASRPGCWTYSDVSRPLIMQQRHGTMQQPRTDKTCRPWEHGW